MNDLTVFNFESQPIRTYADENGEPWFCLSDTCTALNIRQYRVDRLPRKGVTNCRTLTKGGNQELTFVNEPNLYRLVFRSNKPEAQKFADWVYSEVLPSIRKTGSYAVANKEKNSTNIDDIKKPLFLPCAKTVQLWLLKSTGKLSPFPNRFIREYTPGCFN